MASIRTASPWDPGASKGYAEMWGGTVATFPDARTSLAPGQSVDWTEWIYPFQRTGGLTFADSSLATRSQFTPQTGELEVRICPVRELVDANLKVMVCEQTVARHPFSASPTAPWSHVFKLPPEVSPADLLVVVGNGGLVLTRFRPQALTP